MWEPRAFPWVLRRGKALTSDFPAGAGWGGAGRDRAGTAIYSLGISVFPSAKWG